MGQGTGSSPVDTASKGLPAMKLTLVLFILFSILRSATYAQGGTPLLDRADAWLLVMSIPEVLATDSREGCPVIEFDPIGPYLPVGDGTEPVSS